MYKPKTPVEDLADFIVFLIKLPIVLAILGGMGIILFALWVVLTGGPAF